MFEHGMKITEGSKYDATKVSESGLSKEELEQLSKNQRKKIDIFNKDGQAGLSKEELSDALNSYAKYAGEDGKLSRKELKEMAKDMDVKVKDLKGALKGISKLLKEKDDLVPLKNNEQLTISEFKKAPDVKLKDIQIDLGPLEIGDGFSLQNTQEDNNAINLKATGITGQVNEEKETLVKSKTVTDPQTGEKTVHNYTYDGQGRKTFVQISNGETMEYKYQGDSKMPSVLIHKDAQGNIIAQQEYTYNDKGELTSKKSIDSNGNVYEVPQNKKPEGSLLSEVPVTRIVSEQTETTDKVLAKNVKFDNGTSSRIEYTYDNQGRKTIAQFNDGTTIKYSYNGENTQPSELVAFDTNGNVETMQKFEYDTAGNLIEKRILDNNGKLESVDKIYYAEGKPIKTEHKDGNGNITQIDETEYLADGGRKEISKTINNGMITHQSVIAYNSNNEIVDENYNLFAQNN